MVSEIERVSAGFRAEVLGNERGAANEMIAAYGEAYREIASALQPLTQRIEAARAAGQMVDRGWLLREERYRTLLQTVDAEMGHFAQFADAHLVAQQRAAIQAAQTHAVQLAMTGLPSADAAALAVTWNRLPSEAFSHLVGALQNGSPLSSLLNGLAPASSEAVKRVLTSGMAAGWNPRRIGQEMSRSMGGNLTRCLTISRTETMRAYRTASIQAYGANADVVKGWVWMAALSPRTCAACLGMHGTEHPLTETFFGTHPNCRCTPAPITRSWAELGFSDPARETALSLETGEAWLQQQSAVVQAGVLGSPRAAEVFSRGEVHLSDFVHERHSAEWGVSRRAATLTQAEASAALRVPPPPPPPPLPPAFVPDPSRVSRIKTASLESVEQDLFGRVLTESDYATMFARLPDVQVKVSSVPDYDTHSGNEGIGIVVSHPSIASCDRELSRDASGRVFCYNSILQLKTSAQGTGFGTEFFAAQVEGLRAVGVEYMEVDAAGERTDRHWNGYYTWPRLGYDGQIPRHLIQSLQAAESQGKISVPVTLHYGLRVLELMETPEGRNAWKQYGGRMDMTFELDPTSWNSQYLELYLQARKTP